MRTVNTNNKSKRNTICSSIPLKDAPFTTHSIRAMVKSLLVDTEKDGKTKSFILAEMLYNMAAGGNLDALKFIMEQVDGKAPQSLNVNANINDRPDIEKLRGIDPIKISQIIDSAFLDE